MLAPMCDWQGLIFMKICSLELKIGLTMISTCQSNKVPYEITISHISKITVSHTFGLLNQKVHVLRQPTRWQIQAVLLAHLLNYTQRKTDSVIKSYGAMDFYSLLSLFPRICSRVGSNLDTGQRLIFTFLKRGQRNNL